MPPAVTVLCHGIAVGYLSSDNIPPGSFSIYRSPDDVVSAELYFASLTVPPAITVLRESGIAEIHLPVADYPPAVTVLRHGVGIKIHLSILDMPPAVAVLRHGIVEGYLSPDDMPPAFFPIHCSFDDIITVKLYFAALAVPPAITVLRKSGIAEIHFAIPDHPPAITVLRHSINFLDDAILIIVPVPVGCPAYAVRRCSICVICCRSHKSRQSHKHCRRNHQGRY